MPLTEGGRLVFYKITNHRAPPSRVEKPSTNNHHAHYIQNRSIAVGTTWTEQVVIVRLAVRVAIALEEIPGAQLLVAVIAGKVLRVPGFAESGYNLPNDGLIASIAAPLLGGVHSLAAHVGLQISEHRVQLITRRWR